jgi:hypothetical protein
MKTNIKYAMWIMAVAGLYIFAVTFIPPSWRSTEGNEHAKTIVGFLLGSAFTTFIQYYWGNSKKNDPTPEFPKMDEAVKRGTKKLQAAQVEAVKTENYDTRDEQLGGMMSAYKGEKDETTTD